MTIQQCKYVLKISECGSFSKAAQQLFVAQSSLSVSVKVLEKELGIKIFDRGGNGASLTEDGVAFLPYAQRIIEETKLAAEHFAAKEGN